MAMLKFGLFGIPVVIEGWFFLTTALLGGAAGATDPDDWIRVAIWIGVVFVSILVHELGHALAGRKYGATPHIRLHGFGGVTFLPGTIFTRPQNIAVSAAGPAAGFGLGLLVLALRQANLDLPPLARVAVLDAIYVNFVWTLVNLLPIQPLDGGQILGQLLGPRRAALSSSIGFTLATVLCVWAFSRGLLFSAIMLGMLAYYNFRRQPLEGGVVTQ
jgi:Zn-dependent protease